MWIAAGAAPGLVAQTSPDGRAARPQIVDRIDETRLVTLKGNTRPEAVAQNDAGAVSGDLAMEHMLLMMSRSSEQEQALEKAIDQLHDPKSANFHKWLTAAEFGQTYGAAGQDLDTVTAWLRTHGFVVNSVYPSGLVIDFSGTAAQVASAFHTSIHYLDVNGQRHVANMSDPQIPAALKPAVGGVASMNDFSPRAMRKARANLTFTSQGSTLEAVTPQDLGTIYDFTPLFQAGITGQGQTIAVIEDADLYSTADWNTFRSTLGLTQYTSGALTTVHPAPASGGNNCGSPGLGSGDDGETTLDAEWASAAAPNATIQVTACASTRTTFGGLIAQILRPWSASVTANAKRATARRPTPYTLRSMSRRWPKVFP
jgi:subtilase family serine protease